jgi:FkbM family methyltransferase
MLKKNNSTIEQGYVYMVNYQGVKRNMRHNLNLLKAFCARFLRSVIPSSLLHTLIKTLPKPFFNFVVRIFDPNNIRKFIQYNPPTKILTIEDNGWSLDININDHIGYRSYLNNTPFEMSLFHIGQKLDLKEGDIVLDIGANIGTASIPICALKNAELIAVEASKENAMLLASNILKNKLKAQMHTFALTDNNSSPYIEFFIQRGNTGANSIFESWNPSVKRAREVEFAPTITLDRLCENIHVDFKKLRIVKIDVEGAEEVVLKGGQYFLKQNTAPIILEYRKNAAIKYLNDDMEDVVNILLQNNYQLFSLNGDKSELGQFYSDNSYENIVAIKTGTFAEALIG